MKRNDLLLLLFGFLVLLLTGCSPCTEQMTKDNRPEPLDPIDLVVVDDLRPEFSWNYTGCIPEQYEIILYSKATNGGEVDTGLGGLTGSADKNWTPSTDLTIGTHYRWRVAAKAEGADPGYVGDRGEFMVGPTCAYPDLLTPDPVWPEGRVEPFFNWFVWEYPDPTCIPEGYAFQLSRNAEFTDLMVNSREANPVMGYQTGNIFDKCDTYYWRVAAIDGPNDSPWSEVTSFKVDKYNECGYVLAEMADIPELAPICGDGIVNGDEQCDGTDLTMCLSGQQCINCNCITVIEQCGNGIIDEGEQCDGDNLTMCLSTQVCKNCQCIYEMQESEFCEYRPFQNTNCRQSDFADSELLRSLTEEDEVALVALNPEYTHGLFELSDGSQCWIWLGLMDGEENPFGNCPVEIVDPPEAPPESICSEDLDERQCIAAGGEWVEVATRTSYCACPE